MAILGDQACGSKLHRKNVLLKLFNLLERKKGKAARKGSHSILHGRRPRAIQLLRLVEKRKEGGSGRRRDALQGGRDMMMVLTLLNDDFVSFSAQNRAGNSGRTFPFHHSRTTDHRDGSIYTGGYANNKEEGRGKIR